MRLTHIILSAILIGCLTFHAVALAQDTDAKASLPHWSKGKRAIGLNAAIGAGILTWGLFFWDYGDYGFHFRNEEWFGENTKEGGMDKLGHMFTTYVMTNLFDDLYTRWGFSDNASASYAFWSAIGVNGLMEMGDGLSHYGFAYEDMIMNCIGAYTGYLRIKYPKFREAVDLRIEYVPDLWDLNDGDLITDYEHMKYFLALKGSGISGLNATWLKYLELLVGYYAKGYADYNPGVTDDRRQALFAGIGLNVGKLLESVFKSPVFDYLQIPYTYAVNENRVN